MDGVATAFYFFILMKVLILGLSFILLKDIHSINRTNLQKNGVKKEYCNVRIKNNGGIQHERTNESQKIK